MTRYAGFATATRASLRRRTACIPPACGQDRKQRGIDINDHRTPRPSDYASLPGHIAITIMQMLVINVTMDAKAAISRIISVIAGLHFVMFL